MRRIRVKGDLGDVLDSISSTVNINYNMYSHGSDSEMTQHARPCWCPSNMSLESPHELRAYGD